MGHGGKWLVIVWEGKGKMRPREKTRARSCISQDVPAENEEGQRALLRPGRKSHSFGL
jgi:hypothetical protein